MGKLVLLNDCSDCKNGYHYKDMVNKEINKYYCQRERKWHIPDNKEGFPVWCPLPDIGNLCKCKH